MSDRFIKAQNRLINLARKRFQAERINRYFRIYYALGFLLLILGLLFYEWVLDEVAWPFSMKAMASCVMIVGAIPMTLFLYKGDFRSIPFFEGHCFFYSICFGFAGFRPMFMTNRLANITADEHMRGLLAALLGLACLFFGFYFLGHLLFRNVRQFTAGIPDDPTMSPIVILSLIVASVLFLMLTSLGVTWLAQIQQTFIIMTVLLYTVSVYANLLPKWMVIGFWTVFCPWLIFFVSGFLQNGQLGGVIQFGIWHALAWMWAKRRMPLILITGVIAIIFVFQPIKGMYRNTVWSFQMDNRQKVDLLSELLTEHTQSLESSESVKNTFESAFARINHLVVTSGVIRDTPSVEPFQYGSTYYPLFVKWIPRMLWPNKPVEDLGNRWARRYGYLNVNDYGTSFNLPWLTEMYMNFGWFGVVAVSTLVGLLFRFLWGLLARSPFTCFDFCIALSLLSSQILVESHLSMSLGGAVVRAITMVPFVAILKWYIRIMRPTFK